VKPVVVPSLNGSPIKSSDAEMDPKHIKDLHIAGTLCMLIATSCALKELYEWNGVDKRG